MNTIPVAERIRSLSLRQRELLLERLARNDAEPPQQLVAYVKLRPGQQVSNAELRNHLQRDLPDFMVPAHFVWLDSFPLTPNGKIDRNALPAPLADAAAASIQVAPRSEIEQRLGAIWIELLRVPSIGMEDNFFRLGGHSLLALQVMARVRSSFGVDLPLRALFDAPTIAGLAQVIARTPKGAGRAPIRRAIRPGATHAPAPLPGNNTSAPIGAGVRPPSPNLQVS